MSAMPENLTTSSGSYYRLFKNLLTNLKGIMDNQARLLKAMYSEDAEVRERFCQFILSLPISMFVSDMGSKTVREGLFKRLKSIGVSTLGDLLLRNENDLVRYKGIGWMRIDLLQASLQRYGFSIDGPSSRPPGAKFYFGAKWE